MKMRMQFNVMPMLYNLTGSKKSNMAAFKPEVPISKLVDKKGTKVQRLYIKIYAYEVQLPNVSLPGVYCEFASVIQKWRR